MSSSIFDNGPFPACPTPFNLASHVLGQAAHVPDKVALAVLSTGRTDRWSYARLQASVLGVATGFLNLGVKPGDRVLLRLGNGPEFPIAYLAAIAIGVIPVPTSTQLTLPEITRIAAEISPKLVLLGEGVIGPEHPAPVLDTTALRGFYALPPAAFDEGDPNRPAYIIYTSGTSGSPRAVVHAHRAIWARQMMWTGWYGLTPNDRVLHAGAFNWTYTLGTGLMDPWTIGATALIAAVGTPTAMLPLLLKRYDATIFAAAPGVYRQLLRQPMAPMPKLRHGLSAGEKLPQATRLAWQTATGTDIHEAFGMSECSTFLSGNPDRPAMPDTLGWAQQGRHVAILDPLTAKPAAIGAVGTIAIHRDDPGLMLGYLNQPKETAARFSGDWFLTGDQGRATDQGAICYEGRTDDMMNAGGYRVSPIEVETALSLYPGITECAATELHVAPQTTVIAVFYVGPDLIDDSQLHDFAAMRLARYKCPRVYVRVPGLPRGANSKLLRRVLRLNWETDHGQT